MMNITSRLRAIRVATVLWLIVCAGVIVNAIYIRNTPMPVRINATQANIERVANEFRIVSLGEKSVYVPNDQGGTGQRQMAEVWALQVKGANGVYADLIWAWGLTDDVVPFLQAKQRQYETNIDAMMFGQPGYVPVFQFQPF